jgi:hypothetical protein
MQIHTAVISGPRDERKKYIVSFLNSFEEKAWEGKGSHMSERDYAPLTLTFRP